MVARKKRVRFRVDWCEWILGTVEERNSTVSQLVQVSDRQPDPLDSVGFDSSQRRAGIDVATDRHRRKVRRFDRLDEGIAHRPADHQRSDEPGRTRPASASSPAECVPIRAKDRLHPVEHSSTRTL